MALLVARNLRKTYTNGAAAVEAVRGVDFVVEPGEFVAIMGPSGCGKSTLLHLCGGMDRPTGGDLQLEGQSLGALADTALTRLRRERIGFVFQTFNLLPNLTARENVALPLLLAGLGLAEATRRADEALGRVDLTHRRAAYPQQLSGGEMQRAAVARAIVHGPALMIADEPTGNLDSVNGLRVLEIMRELNRDRGVTILLATHSHEIAAASSRVYHMRDGRFEPEAADREPAGTSRAAL